MSASQDPLVTALAGRYTIERELGAGGMATVYLAHDVRHNRKVAVKVLRPELAAVLGAGRFLREIEVTANLQHPNILPLFDSGEADGFVYYVMPFVDGESLRDRLNREKQLPIDETVRITIAIANALEYAHGQDVIHRDIKPENVLLQHGQAVVADFGIALAVRTAGGERLTETGLSLGTPEYMSPEQASGDRQLDARSDVYSLAAVVYEMLTGEPPHTGKTVEAIVAKLLTTAPVRPRTIRQGVPESLDTAVMRALSKTPADRYASAQQFAEEVERAGAGGPEVGPAARVPVSRLTKLTMSAAAAVALAAAAVLVAPRLSDRSMRLYPNRVVVPPFENQTGDSTLNSFGGYAAQWITQGLYETGVLEPVRSDIVAPLVVYLEHQQDAGLAVDPVRTLTRETGAGLAITGSYYLVRDSLQIQWQIVDAEGGGIVSAPQPVVASRNAPDRAVQEIRSRVMGGLSYRVQQTVSGLPSPGGDPPSWQAFKEVDAGERAFRSGRGLEAINPLERAAALDTGQLGSWSLLLLAMTHRNLGTETGDRDTTHLVQADSIFELVDGRTDRLSPFEVTFLEVGKASVKGDYLAALRASREGARKYPRSLTPYAAGYLARLANRPHEAAYWFETVDRDAPAVQNWIFLWTQASSTYHNLGDFKRQLEWTRQYRERFPQAAGPYFYEIVARAASGEYQQVLRLLEDGYDKGLPPCTDAAWWAWGEFRAHGYPVFADSVLAQVVERYRASPDTVPGCLQRQLFEAQGEWKEVRDIHVSTGSGPGFQDSLDYKGQLAVYDARIGNREAALATSQQLGAMDSPYMLGRGTIWRARIAAVLGDHAEAVSLIKQAYDEGLMYWYPLHLDRSFESLRDDPAYREVIRPRDEDWHAPGAERNKLLLALIAAGLLSATLVWFLGRRRGPHTAAA